MRHVRRGGRYYRTHLPHWVNPLDITHSSLRGGRWNPRGGFGALYLSRDLATARANAVRIFDGEIATLFDLQPVRRPMLQPVAVRPHLWVDAVTPAGRRQLHLAVAYRPGQGWSPCQRVARRAYAAGEHGVAAASAAAASMGGAGEELAVFDRSTDAVVADGAPLRFSEWFPITAGGARLLQREVVLPGHIS